MPNPAFRRQLEKAYEKKIEKPMRRFVGAVVTDLFRTVATNVESTGGKFGSPVYSGRFYTSHSISLNTPKIEVTFPNAAGPENPLPPLNVEAEVAAAMVGFKFGDTIYITNATSYADEIEKGKASSKTPRGVYKVAVELAKIKYVRVKPRDLQLGFRI